MTVKVNAALDCPYPGDKDRPCLHAKGWCDGPDHVDLDAATLGVCADCIAVATAGGGR